MATKGELTDIEVKLMRQLESLPDEATGYNRVTVEFYDLDMQDLTLEHLTSRGYVNGVFLGKPAFGPREVAYALSSLTPKGRAALAKSS